MSVAAAAAVAAPNWGNTGAPAGTTAGPMWKQGTATGTQGVVATTGHLPHANTQWPPVSCYVRDNQLVFIPERPIGEGSRIAYQFSGGFIFYFAVTAPPDNTPTSVKGYITTPPQSDQGTCEAVLVAYVPG